MVLYNETSKKEALNKMQVNEYGTYIMYFNDEDGTFKVGLYSTGTVESDEFYEHNHEVLRTPNDLSQWLGCFDCGECSGSIEEMNECFIEQCEEEIDEDIIRESVMDICKETLQEDMDLILEIIGTIYEKYYSTNKYLWWCVQGRDYYESACYDYIIEGLEESDLEYYGKELFDREWFESDVREIIEVLTFGINDLDIFYKLMEDFKFEEALKLLKEE